MIDTITLKQHLRTIFEIGSDQPQETILIVGSCRTISFLNYLDRYNRMAGLPFKIYFIEPFYFHWDEQERRMDIHEELAKLETNERVLMILRNTTIFIHEHLGNYDIFNTDSAAVKNIYQFGMAAPVDISIPNFNDHFILWNDFGDFGQVPDDWSVRGWGEIDKFCNLCPLTSFPEMGDYFRENWQSTRFFWRPNHTSKEFTLKIFRLMNDKFLNLDLSQEFWDGAGQEDLFRDPHTNVTDMDRDAYQITWTA